MAVNNQLQTVVLKQTNELLTTMLNNDAAALPKGLQREYRRYISSAENKAAADYQVPLNQEILRP